MGPDPRRHRRVTPDGGRVPTPNIFTGGKNFHGKTEWVSLWGMETAVQTVIHLAQVWVEKSAE